VGTGFAATLGNTLREVKERDTILEIASIEMNRCDLLRHPLAQGCLLHRRGKEHDIWINPANRAISPIPRHTRVKRGTA
jgi:hypothetical protein